MDFGKFEVLRSKVGDNEELASVVSELETQAKTLYENKESAVGEVKKFKGLKHNIAETFGFDKEIATDELLNNVKAKYGDLSNKIDSFQKTASSKELENASVKEQLNSLTSQLSEITNQLNSEREANKLNSIKDSFRKALANNRISDTKAQDIAINSHMNLLSGDVDYEELAKSIATEMPFLTQSVHKGGTGSVAPNGQYNNEKSISTVDIKDTKGRQSAVETRLRNRGLI